MEGVTVLAGVVVRRFSGRREVVWAGNGKKWVKRKWWGGLGGKWEEMG